VLASLQAVLTTIAACGGAGAAIDFWIKKTGQQRVRSWLETWWLRLSYVRWGNFGREEALFAVEAIDRLFGSRLFSIRRMIVVVAAILVVACLLLLLIDVNGYIASFPWSDTFLIGSHLTWFISIFLSLAASLSLTRFAAQTVASIITKISFLNVIGSVSLLIFQYMLVCYWSSIISFTHFSLIIENASRVTIVSSLTEYFIFSINAVYNVNPLPVAQFQRISSFFTIDKEDISPLIFTWRLSDLVALLPTLIRLLIISIFLGSFVLQGVRRPIMNLWERVVISDQPIFTLLFGGAGGTAKIIEEIVKAFWG
jgi:hypothetical protein